MPKLRARLHKVESLNTHSPASCSLYVIRFFPIEVELFPKESGKRRKERRCLTGSPGVLTAFGTVCNRPDEEGVLFVISIPYVAV